MDALTLNWLIHQSGLTNLKCAACSDKLDNPVSSVNILDNPDVIKWIKRDELVLTTGYIFLHDNALRSRIMRELRDADCAALCVKVKQYLPTVPQAMIEEAEQMGLVLIEVPFYYPFSEICKLVYNKMYEQKLTDEMVWQRRLESVIDLSFSGAGLDAMIHAVSDMLGKSVIATNAEHSCVAVSLMPGDAYLLSSQGALVVDPNCFSAEKGHVLQQDRSIYRQSVTISGHIVNCLVKGFPNNTGFLYLILDPADSTENLAELFNRLSRIIMLELRETNRSAGRTKLYYDYFFDFLQMEETKPAGEIVKLCNFYGFQYTNKRVCITMIPHDFENAEHLARAIQFLRCDYRQMLEEANPCFCSYNNDMVCFFLYFPQDVKSADCIGAAAELLKRFDNRLRKNLPCPVRIGVSRCHSKVETIKTAFDDSIRSIQIGRKLHMDGPVYLYNQLITYVLLADLAPENLRKMYRDSVQPLVEYDARNHTDLLDTLSAYFENKFNAVATAKQLFLHRNTLVNRIEKCQQLLGIDLDDPGEYNRIYLGLCAYRLIKYENYDR